MSLLKRSKTRNKIKSMEREQRASLIYNINITLVSLGLIAGFVFMKNDISVHVPPDLSNGAILKEGDIPKENTYMFSMNLWQSLNYWPDSGVEDMRSNLDAYQCYLTPTFRQYLTSQHQMRIRKGLSNGLARTASTMHESPYDSNKVTSMSKGQWEVKLDLRIQESLDTTITREIPLRYRLIVVSDDSSQSCNPFGLKLAGLIGEPMRLEVSRGGVVQ